MFAEVNGIRLSYSDTGEGYPVFMIPGFAADRRFWKDMVGELKDFRCISVDNRGSGNTEYKGKFEIEDLAEDIISLAGSLGIRRFNIIGWSMGTHIAEKICASHPETVNRCVLVSSYLRRPSRVYYFLKNFTALMEQGKISDEGFCILMNSFCFTEDEFRKMEENGNMPSQSMDFDTEGLKRQIDAVNNYDPYPAIEKIEAPVMVIHGSEDTMVPLYHAEELSARLKDSELIIMEGAGHRICPASYGDLVREFFSRRFGQF